MLPAQEYVIYQQIDNSKTLEGGEQRMIKVAQKTQRGSMDSGFTLIELLIVIIIIGILSGILISILDPIRQQNRARNATVEAAINKVAFNLNAVRSALGRLPAELELANEMQNVTLDPDTCTDPFSDSSVDRLTCRFMIEGALLPGLCDSSSPVMGDGTADCMYVVVSQPLINGAFRIVARGWELTPTAGVDAEDFYYIFDSRTALWKCPAHTGSTAYNNINNPSDGSGDLQEYNDGCILVGGTQ